jgi:rhodanese-related sulfurtransferase
VWASQYYLLLLSSAICVTFHTVATSEAQQELSLQSLSAVIHQQFPEVKTITSAELLAAQKSGERIILLDTRSKEEFAVSHLLSARWVDPATTDLVASLEGESSSTAIIAYCSVGYRSASVIDRLKKSRFTNLRNLEGGIFDWGNEKLPMVDAAGHATRMVHPYNLLWGQYLSKALWSKKPL